MRASGRRDWYGDGRVDKIFPLHCYQEAIRSLPVDVLDYSNAKEDILRALAFAKPEQAGPRPDRRRRRHRPDGRSGRPYDRWAGATRATRRTGRDVGVRRPVDTSGPSSVPIPLLILGGLALLLLAAGGAGYLSRRAQARRRAAHPAPPESVPEAFRPRRIRGSDSMNGVDPPRRRACRILVAVAFACCSHPSPAGADRSTRARSG